MNMGGALHVTVVKRWYFIIIKARELQLQAKRSGLDRGLLAATRQIISMGLFFRVGGFDARSIKYPPVLAELRVTVSATATKPPGIVVKAQNALICDIFTDVFLFPY